MLQERVDGVDMHAGEALGLEFVLEREFNPDIEIRAATPPFWESGIPQVDHVVTDAAALGADQVTGGAIVPRDVQRGFIVHGAWRISDALAAPSCGRSC